MTPFKDYFWKYIWQGVFISCAALCGILIIAYSELIVFLKGKQLASSLNVATYTVREAMHEGDWSLVIGHLMKLGENGPVFHIKLTGSTDDRANLTGPFGEKPFGAGRFCKTVIVSDELKLSGCMRIFGESEITTLLLFILFSSILFFMIFKIFRSKMLLIIGDISDSLNEVHLMGSLDRPVSARGVEEITEIVSIREYISLLLKEVEAASKVVAISQLSAQVAHDIRSPLVALEIIVNDIKSIPEEQRIILRNATNRINDIANNLLTQYRQNKNLPSSNLAEKTNPELISNLLMSLISEKRVQYRNKTVNFLLTLEENAYGKFSAILSSDFYRVLSNLINNSIDAGSSEIKIFLNARDVFLTIKIQDNGNGIPYEFLSKIRNGESVTNKKQGHGIGMSHAIKIIENEWRGQISIESAVNAGTTVEINLPQSPAPKWFLSELKVNPGKSIVILDDDESIHQVWMKRFQELDAVFNFIHFYTPQELIHWHNGHANAASLFLIDYEYIGCDENGFDVIETLKIENHAYLVTSRHDDSQVQKRSEKMNLKIIPKTFSIHIPIVVSKLNFPEPVDLIFIDDDIALTYAWVVECKRKGKVVAPYNSSDAFRMDKHQYDFSTPIFIDSDLKEGIKGQDFGRELYDFGFKNIYLSTGYSPDHFPKMYWIKDIIGKQPIF